MMKTLIFLTLILAITAACRPGEASTEARKQRPGPRIKVELHIATRQPRPNAVKMSLAKDEKEIYYLDPKPFVDDTMVEKAFVYQSELGDHCVGMQFNSSGAVAVKAATGQNIRRFVAIVLDGKLHSTPQIQSVISKSGQITGLEKAEAERISASLNRNR